ncbi:MAG TPA: CopD family protein [Kribbella sp.]|nr:CopD family protein [Kribbella sp.]
MTVQPERERTGSAPALVVAIAVAGSLAMVVALLAAGGAPKSTSARLAGASTTVSWAVPVLRLLADLAAIACCSGVMAAVVLLPATAGRLTSPGLRACQDAAAAAGVWAVASIGLMVTTATVILGIPLAHLGTHANDAAGLDQVRALVAAVLLTAVLAVVLSGCRTVATARVALVLAAAALTGPLLTGHGAFERTAFWSILATASLVVHVFAVTAWVGGLWALLRYVRSGDSAVAVGRFSRLALACAVSIGFSGLLTAEVHLGGREAGWGLISQWVTSGYGAVVFAKALAFTCLVTIGWWHRRSTLPGVEAGRPGAFWRLAVVELVLMAATVGLAVALSRTP